MGELIRRNALIALAKGWKGPKPLPAKPHRKRMRIDEFLTWAYREELPKTGGGPAGPSAPAGGWDQVARWAEELPLAGLDDNRFGVVPDWLAPSGPHPDAVLAHAAVQALDSWPLCLPDEWNPLADMPGLGLAGEAAVARAVQSLATIGEDGARWLRRGPARLVFRAAIMRHAPDWHIDVPVTDVERHENGKGRWFVREVHQFDGAFGPASEEFEHDGWDERRKQPRIGAYQKSVLRPDPHDGIVARAEYEITRAALCVLAEDLASVLHEHDVVPPDWPERPWEEDAVTLPCVWRVKSASALASAAE